MSARVLVVDDNEAARRILTEYLAGLSFRVDAVASGRYASLLAETAQ